jgi:hypothetical protein
MSPNEKYIAPMVSWTSANNDKLQFSMLIAKGQPASAHYIHRIVSENKWTARAGQERIALASKDEAIAWVEAQWMMGEQT